MDLIPEMHSTIKSPVMSETGASKQK